MAEPRTTQLTCEVIEKWYGGKDDGPIYCGAPALWEYPAVGGPMRLCEAHVGPHSAYVTRIPSRPPSGADDAR